MSSKAPMLRNGALCPEPEAERLRAALLSHQLDPAHQLTHEWRMGDLVLYDNSQLLHSYGIILAAYSTPPSAEENQDLHRSVLGQFGYDGEARTKVRFKAIRI